MKARTKRNPRADRLRARRIFLNASLGGKMYRLRFSAGETGPTRYLRCYTAVVLTGRQVAVSEWDDVIALLKKLKQIGRDTTQATNLDVPATYVLNDAGGEVSLQRSEYNLLLDLIKQPIWRPSVLESVQECKLWLEGLKSEEPSVNS